MQTRRPDSVTPVGPKEARIERTEHGAVAATPGWFVLNLADARWRRSEVAGQWSDFEPPDGFKGYGIGVHVLQPGQPNGKYHAESVQEDFLVLSGERPPPSRLRSGTSRRGTLYCTPGTHHTIVGAGEGSCAILMTGVRGEGKTLHYPVSEVAGRYGASAPEETDAPRVAYGDWPGNYEPVRANWPL